MRGPPEYRDGPKPFETPRQRRARWRDWDRKQREQAKKARDPEYIRRVLPNCPGRIELWESEGAEKGLSDEERALGLLRLLPIAPARWASTQPDLLFDVAAWATHPGTILRLADLPSTLDVSMLQAAKELPWRRLDRGSVRRPSLAWVAGQRLFDEPAESDNKPLRWGRLEGATRMGWDKGGLTGMTWFTDRLRMRRWTWFFGRQTDDVAVIAEECAPGTTTWHHGCAARVRGSQHFTKAVWAALEAVEDVGWVEETHAESLQRPTLGRLYEVAPAEQARIATELLERLEVATPARWAALCGGAEDAIEVLRDEEARRFEADDDAVSEACLAALVALDPEQGLAFEEHVQAARDLGELE